MRVPTLGCNCFFFFFFLTYWLDGEDEFQVNMFSNIRGIKNLNPNKGIILVKINLVITLVFTYSSFYNEATL